MTASETQGEMIRQAYPLVAIEARRCPLPPGVGVDDLESLGGEALVAAAAEYGGPADEWKKYAKFYLRNQMRSFCQKARKRAARHAPLEVPVELGGGDVDFVPRPDPRASDPGELAAVRELLPPAPRTATEQPARVGRKTLPSPNEVAARVTELRSAMFGAIDIHRVEGMMRKLQAKAEAGDLRAMKLLIDLLAPGRSGVTVNQQAVVIQSGDLS